MKCHFVIYHLISLKFNLKEEQFKMPNTDSRTNTMLASSLLPGLLSNPTLSERVSQTRTVPDPAVILSTELFTMTHMLMVCHPTGCFYPGAKKLSCSLPFPHSSHSTGHIVGTQLNFLYK